MKHRRHRLAGSIGTLWRRVRQDETVLVARGPRADFGLLVHAVVMFLVGLAALVAVNVGGGLVSAVASGVLGGLIGYATLSRQRRARAYWSGWLTGRSEMVSSLGEASKREMSMQDWLTTQFDRDVAVIGLPDNREHPTDEDAPDG